jgi:hypothetical protein
MKKEIIVKTLIPLFFGSLIYILFRSSSLNMFAWFDLLGINHFIDFLRQQLLHVKLWKWIIYSLPNGLWLFSFINLFLIIWERQICKFSLIWLIIPPTLGIGSEILQYFGLIHGTFDYIDLIICIIATIIPFLSEKSLTIKWKNIKWKNLKLSFSIIGCFIFLILAYGSNGPADGFQNWVIKTEKDPIKKEKMSRKEEFFIIHGRKKLTDQQSDSIDHVVDSLARIGKI